VSDACHDSENRLTIVRFLLWLFFLRSSFPNAVCTLSRDSSDIGKSEDSGKSEESRSDSRSSSSEEDEELGGMWCSIFREVLSTKQPQTVDLTSFGGEVPPFSAWGEAESDRTRYVSFPSSRRRRLGGQPEY
jgi:hypothetical protein